MDRSASIKLDVPEDLAAIIKFDVLERLLSDESVEPTDLPLSLLEYITNNFSDDNKIGRGGFAVVYKGMLRNGMIAVKKLIIDTNFDETKFYREVECLKNAKHKNVVRFLGYCADTQEKRELYKEEYVMAVESQNLLCFEYLPKGNLHDYIRTASSCEVEWRQYYQIIKGICTGLQYLHNICIVHSDLKPTNILLDDNMVPKIADFGLSRRFDEDQSRVFTSNRVGSLGYLAPEYIDDGTITFKSDIFSLGVIIKEILTGQRKNPEDYDVQEVLESWGNRLEKLHKEKQLEQLKLCIEIGKECVDKDPTKRPDARTIVGRLDEADIAQHWIYICSGVEKWNAYDGQHWIQLPNMPADGCFKCSTKNSLVVGTDLLVFGQSMDVKRMMFRYSILTNSWIPTDPVKHPRFLFGSTSVGQKAYLAGGVDRHGGVLRSVAIYDSKKKCWQLLPSMHRSRMKCSGVFMDGKLYVIGGVGRENVKLTCSEEYDFEQGSWRVIKNMCQRLNVEVTGAPPLVAVVKNELYGADYTKKYVKKYDKQNERWIRLGELPDLNVSIKGWGIGFKACGDQLIVIGGSRSSTDDIMIELHAWVPDERPLVWNLIARRNLGNFMFNAAVMSC